MMKDNFIIPQGPTFHGTVSTIGIFIIVAGGVFLVKGISELNYGIWYRFIIGVILLVTGLQVFISIRGVIIDRERKRLKNYILVFFRIGDWVDISEYDGFKKESFDETETGGIRSAFVTVHTKYVDLFLLHKNKEDKLLLRSCPSSRSADDLAEEVRQYLGLNAEG